MRKFWISALLFVLLANPAGAQDAVRAIVEKAIKAQGGAEMLDRYNAGRARVKATINLAGGEIPAMVETTVQLPNQFKNVMQVEINGKKQTIVQVLNGDMGWMTIEGKTKPLDAGELATLKESFYADQAYRLTPLLRDKNYQLSAVPETKVDSRPALGVKVVHRGRPDINLFFDKASGLLVKSERRTKEAGNKDILQEEILRDYKELKGVQRPMKFLVFRDGKKFMEASVIEFTPLEKVDPKEFAKP